MRETRERALKAVVPQNRSSRSQRSGVRAPN
jgi:hypothetical protein